MRVVRAELLTQGVAHLADRAAGRESVAHRRQQVGLAAGGLANPSEGGIGVAVVSLRTGALRALDPAPFRLGIEAMKLHVLLLALFESVHAHDDPLPGFDLALERERRLLDLVLRETLLDRLDRAAELVDPLDQLPGALLELTRERLNEERAAKRIGGVGPSRFVREDLLRSKGDSRRPLARQRERLIEPVRVDRLRATADG